MNKHELWRAIDAGEWHNTPFISARLATEQDVKSGRAVFFLKNDAEFGCAPYEMSLPHLAIRSDPETNQFTPGVIIQAEHVDGKVLLGFRPLSGGNVLALLEEFRLVNDVAEFENVES